MSELDSVRDRALISTESAKSNIAKALSLFMGQGRPYSVEDVAEALGMKGQTLYSYVRENDRHTPPGDVLLRLCHFFGPRFTLKVLTGTGQGAHWLDPQPGDPGYVVAKLVQGSAEFAWRGADHQFCPSDCGKLEPVADEMIEILQPFSSRGAEQ